MKANQILQGDALTELRKLPDGIVQTCVTSPPYFNLRDYSVPGQIGLEDTPEAFIEKLVDVFREVRRVLRHDGTAWVNMGDTYANDEKWGGSTGGKHVQELHGDNATRRRRYTGLPAKNMMGMPWRLAFALQADGWILRSEIIWYKPTAMPESVTDRPTKAHEQIFLLAKSERYFYDADSIREPLRPKTYTTFGTTRISKGNDPLGKVKSANIADQIRQPRLDPDGNPAGANKRTVWTVASYAYIEAHFATFPPKLIEPCILAGTSPRACEQCGSPWERVTVPTGHVNKRELAHAPYSAPTKVDSTGWAPTRVATDEWQATCKCTAAGRGQCIVLDPFMGAGTTALVSLQHGRDYLGIELNPAYITLAEKRIACVEQNLWEAGIESEATA